MNVSFAAPYLADPSALRQTIQTLGYAVVRADHVFELSGIAGSVWNEWTGFWENLPSDNYLRDGGKYRRRRHSSFVVKNGLATQVPHRPHWQPLEYNALHGGLERHFEPMLPEMVSPEPWRQLLVWLAKTASDIKGAQPWFIEAHQFRIDTTDGIGRPTPEGAHRDGVDFVAVFMVQRSGIKGGETRVFDADGPTGQRFTLMDPWSLLILDDVRVIHETTPIQPVHPGGYRDTLVVTLRSRSFQEEQNTVAQEHHDRSD